MNNKRRLLWWVSLSGLLCFAIFQVCLWFLLLSGFRTLNDPVSWVDHWRRGEMLYLRNWSIAGSFSFVATGILEQFVRVLRKEAKLPGDATTEDTNA